MADCPDGALRAELLRRRVADQDFRRRAVRQAGHRVNETAASTGRTRSGWPRFWTSAAGPAAMVGEDGAVAAWLLAQHADEQPRFQRRCLRLLSTAVRAGEAPMWQWAYLLDRVLVNEHRPQSFGTQVTVRGSAY